MAASHVAPSVAISTVALWSNVLKKVVNEFIWLLFIDDLNRTLPPNLALRRLFNEYYHDLSERSMAVFSSALYGRQWSKKQYLEHHYISKFSGTTHEFGLDWNTLFDLIMEIYLHDVTFLEADLLNQEVEGFGGFAKLFHLRPKPVQEEEEEEDDDDDESSMLIKRIDDEEDRQTGVISLQPIDHLSQINYNTEIFHKFSHSAWIQTAHNIRESLHMLSLVSSDDNMINYESDSFDHRVLRNEVAELINLGPHLTPDVEEKRQELLRFLRV